jgi:hypothetical protein
MSLHNIDLNSVSNGNDATICFAPPPSVYSDSRVVLSGCNTAAWSPEAV